MVPINLQLKEILAVSGLEIIDIYYMFVIGLFVQVYATIMRGSVMFGVVVMIQRWSVTDVTTMTGWIHLWHIPLGSRNTVCYWKSVG